MNVGNENAFIGRNVEVLFKNSVGDVPQVVENIRAKFNLTGTFESAILSGIHGEKADVKMGFSCGHNIDANIKAYRGTGFNQLTRASVRRFSELFLLTEEQSTNLQQLVIQKSRTPSNPLFPDDKREQWRAILTPHIPRLIKWGFSSITRREILVLFDRDESKMRIYAMSDVLRCLPRDVTFTKGGFNIGECISFQRKGGNGSLSRTIPKNDIRHPGNDVQLKIKPRKFVCLMERIKIAEYQL